MSSTDYELGRSDAEIVIRGKYQHTIDRLRAACEMALEENWYRRDIDYYEEWLIVTSALRDALAETKG